MIQSGDGDWIINFRPTGNRLRSAFHSYRSAQNACSDFKRGFLFGGLSPPNKKINPLRPRRLCVENPIFDKSDESLMMITMV